MWILYAVIVHLLLLGSIFVIYFRSPVLTGLRPQKDLTELGLKPPAKRLVLIVTDGLRAESFFRNNCNDVPNLRNLILEKGGLVGVSHTRVPTESRPGHIALIAGLYEDPSAVLRGWKENPIDFDTVFNRSRSTYAWGADDVLHIFSRLDDGGKQRLFFEAYDHDLDFSGRNDTYALDEWVFERVKFLLARKSKALQDEEQVVFFLHLLGLDSAGHIHKPGSKDFLSNLHNTEREIVEIYRHFEHHFPDGKTAYVLTSDHGMTDGGSHGAGANYETETPFYLFGSGIAKSAPNRGKTFKVAHNNSLGLHEMEQAQFAPLMSALIGIAPPMNNFGTLPVGFMNVDKAYEATAALNNALQLLAQFQKLFEEHQYGLFATILRHYKPLDTHIIKVYELSSRNFLNSGNYDKALEISQNMMHLALDGIDYYHGYYRNTLLMCTSATFLGWILYLLQLLIAKKSYGSNHYQHTRLSTPILFFIATLVLIYVYMQQVPFTIAFYFLVPIFVWMLALQQRLTLSALWYHYKTHKFQLLLLVCCAEILVLGFFQRQVISLAFVLFAIMNNLPAFARRDYRFYIWLVLVSTLAVFPLLPPTVGYKNDLLLLIGIFWCLTRPFLVKTHISLGTYIVGILGILNALYCIYCNTQRLAIPIALLFISWCYLIYTFLILLFNSSKVLKLRLELIFFSFTAFYNLLCTSYESIFVMMLATELLISLAAHESKQTSTIAAQHSISQNSAQHLQCYFRLALTILLYTFFSFFGTGNIASVSSFDPNIIRCFLTTFLPFVIMALVILKLIIPVILNICIIYAMSDFARQNERQIFICLLLICDVMGLNFLFLVRNKGSWLDIGTSISHFVIMEVTTLGLLLLTLPAKLFLKLKTVTPLSFKLK